MKDPADPKASAEKATTAYTLGMPLLANQEVYEAQKEQFLKLLRANGEQVEHSLWMKGRLLLAAYNANYLPYATEVARGMQEEMDKGYAQHTAMGCWAQGYLAAYYAIVDTPQYVEARILLRESVNVQRAQYDQSKKTPEDFSSIMWTYAMAIQAVAFAKDKREYEHYSRCVMSLSEYVKVESAIEQLEDKEFPAWLASIFYQSTMRMGDSIDKQNALRVILDKAYERSTSDENRMMADAFKAFCKERVPAEVPALSSRHSSLTK